MFTKFSSQKKILSGFTLLEVLVVISIIGILATIAISSYGSVRKQGRLDLGLDGVITALKEQQSKARNGRVETLNNAAQPFCFGLSFKKDTPFVEYLSMPYVLANSQGADMCQGDEKIVPYNSFEELEVKKIVVNDTEYENVDIVFKPPFGKAVMRSGQGNFSSFARLEVTIGPVAQSQNTSQLRIFEFDSTTGNIRRIIEQ